MQPVRVVLVDDQELIRRGLRLLLEISDNIQVVGEAADGVEGLSVIQQTSPDVVLTDARMPRMDGVELITRLAALPVAPPAIMLTTFDDDTLVRAALDAGAAGFLMKDASVDELVRAIMAVVEGGLVIDPRVARLAMRRKTLDAASGSAPVTPDEQPEPSPLKVLTRAEMEVAERLATGATNREIAGQLNLAEGTVKNHVSSLLRKLEQRDRTGLALLLSRYLGGPAG